MTTLTLWLLLTLPADPRDTKPISLYQTREECEQAQVSEFLYGNPARCQAIQIPKGKK